VLDENSLQYYPWARPNDTGRGQLICAIVAGNVASSAPNSIAIFYALLNTLLLGLFQQSQKQKAPPAKPEALSKGAL
jgi:hypothetical protein